MIPVCFRPKDFRISMLGTALLKGTATRGVSGVLFRITLGFSQFGGFFMLVAALYLIVFGSTFALFLADFAFDPLNSSPSLLGLGPAVPSHTS